MRNLPVIVLTGAIAKSGSSSLHFLNKVMLEKLVQTKYNLTIHIVIKFEVSQLFILFILCSCVVVISYINRVNDSRPACGKHSSGTASIVSLPLRGLIYAAHRLT